MKTLDKGSVVFKHKAQDFIVEELNNEDKLSEISKDISAFQNTKVDFGNLDVNDRRDFIMFDLEKINIDHFNAISILCEKLKKSPHEIGYAGSKDKIAWTSQRISVFNPDIEKIRNFSHEGMILKNFRWGKHKIKIGDLKGNKFRITLRDVDKESIKILNRVRNIEYIPNFFGNQRFGSVRHDNYQIGKLIFKRKYKEAVFAYLTGYGESESEEIIRAKRTLKKEKDLENAKKYLPMQLRTEHRILEYLSKNKEDYIGALKCIGEKILLIMAQSVQSRLFNEILEKGIERGIISEEDSLFIPGYNQSNSEGKLKHVEKEILDINDIKLEDFKNSDIPELTLTAAKRKAFFKVKEVNIETLDDEIFNLAKKIKIGFTLSSGSYATTMLEYFFDLR